MIDYLDPDVAYLLGLVTTRGQLIEQPPIRRLVITFPFRNLLVQGVKTVFDQQTQLKIGASQISDRLSELLGTHISVVSGPRNVTLMTVFVTNSIAWRDLNLLLVGKTSYKEFQVPAEIVHSPIDVKKEFIRGVVDGSGWVEPATVYRNSARGKRRIFIAIDNSNWLLSIQLCSLLQQQLRVPVGEILWGHPNLRDPQAKHPKGRGMREHQIRVFCESFAPVRFNLDYKNQILQEFIDEDTQGRDLPTAISFCEPQRKRNHRRPKASHPQEQSSRLPRQLRGKHYDRYWQICKALGCPQ